MYPSRQSQMLPLSTEPLSNTKALCNMTDKKSLLRMTRLEGLIASDGRQWMLTPWATEHLLMLALQLCLHATMKGLSMHAERRE